MEGGRISRGQLGGLTCCRLGERGKLKPLPANQPQSRSNAALCMNGGKAKAAPRRQVCWSMAGLGPGPRTIKIGPSNPQRWLWDP
jgi:hypothetical protein